MPRLTTAVVIGALVLAPLAAVAVPAAADAATPPRHNVLATWCDSHHHRDCVVTASDDYRRLVVRNHGGHRIDLSKQATAVRYLRRHATPCAQEDSARCFWDASTAGNGVGDSFLVIGGRAEGTGTLVYLDDVSR